ncbi:MAG: hypothetical protein EB071_01150 [Gammaproteobacteria bacterium]|nr:hypothetical protein [Gammaproteobacteria bacterium]
MRRPIITLLWLILTLSGCGVQLEGSVANQRQQLRSMEADSLSKLYLENPTAKSRVQQAAGYAVFDASGGQILWGGLDHGNGVAVDNRSGKRTYMKMFELQPGLGFGYTNFRLVFVFDTVSAMEDFIGSGWEFGGRASAAAKGQSEGGAAAAGVNVAPGINVYQLTQQGALIGLSVTGAKYWRNDDLN